MNLSFETINCQLKGGFAFVRDNLTIGYPETSVAPAVLCRFHLTTREVSLAGNM